MDNHCLKATYSGNQCSIVLHIMVMEIDIMLQLAQWIFLKSRLSFITCKPCGGFECRMTK